MPNFRVRTPDPEKQRLPIMASAVIWNKETARFRKLDSIIDAIREKMKQETDRKQYRKLSLQYSITLEQFTVRKLSTDSKQGDIILTKQTKARIKRLKRLQRSIQ